jgi:hypothetical protein
VIKKLLIIAAVMIGGVAVTTTTANATVISPVHHKPPVKIVPVIVKRPVLPPPLLRPAPAAPDGATVTQSISFVVAEPSDLYAHVTTTELPGLVALSENIYCNGILQESGQLSSLNGYNTTPAEYAITPVYNNGLGCTVDITAVTVGQDMGTVGLSWTTTP